MKALITDCRGDARIGSIVLNRATQEQFEVVDRDGSHVIVRELDLDERNDPMLVLGTIDGQL